MKQNGGSNKFEENRVFMNDEKMKSKSNMKIMGELNFILK